MKDNDRTMASVLARKSYAYHFLKKKEHREVDHEWPQGRTL